MSRNVATGDKGLIMSCLYFLLEIIPPAADFCYFEFLKLPNLDFRDFLNQHFCICLRWFFQAPQIVWFEWLLLTLSRQASINCLGKKMSLLGQFLEFTTTHELWFHKNMSRLKQVRYLMWAHKYNYYKHGTSYATSPPQAKFWGFPLCLHWIFFVLRADFFQDSKTIMRQTAPPAQKLNFLGWFFF